VAVVVVVVAAVRIADRTSPRRRPAGAARQSLHCGGKCAAKHWQGHGRRLQGGRRCQRGLLEALAAGGGWARAAPRRDAAGWPSAAELARAVA
jgi:hypothetical protein